MNRFTKAVTSLNFEQTKQLLGSQPKWRTWFRPDGKNALHFLCGTPVVSKWNVPADELKPPDPAKAERSLAILKLLVKAGLDVNSIHRIPDRNCGHFPATPVWYAYTRGRNEKLYKWLLHNGGCPDHCLFAIAWYDDVKAAELFKKFGALGAITGAKSSPPYEGGVAAASADGVVLSDARDPAMRTLESAVRKLSECLLAALFWKKFKIAEWLLKNGADPDITDPQGRTPLLYLVKKKYPAEPIRLLIRYGADPDRENPKGESARKVASSYRDKSFSKLLN